MTAPSATNIALDLGAQGLVFGCDYNPEQWDRVTWCEDVRLMTEAGITLVAINIFGWSHVEPRDGVFDFSDLDEVIHLLADAGISINLGTGTSSPPPWLTARSPEILPMVADGTRRWPGGRQAWCPSSSVFRDRALRLVRATAERYGKHPAVKLWHVSNELGCHNALCYCDVSAEAFRAWLRERYVSLNALNSAWGTSFWSQRYSDWNEILPPRATLSFINPAQTLDFARFSSDELLDHYRAEARVIRELSPIPITTNFMVTAHIRTQDYWTWASDMDVIANDHYLDHRLDAPHRELSFSADATRGLAGGQPWLLMEHSTSAVNWQPRNHAKTQGEMKRNSLAHVARGADGVCFFQWRASVQGTEKYHSALLPHAGTESRVWREVLELGTIMKNLGELQGSRVQADVALVFSWEAWWAADLEAHPSSDVRYLDQVHAMYDALWASGTTVDVVPPGAPLEGYRLVVVPNLYLISDAHAAVIRDFVSSGGHAVITFFSGIVDENDRVRTGGYPGAFRDLLGVSAEEFFPLSPDERVELDDGTTATLWAEVLTTTTATGVTHFAGGALSGTPAVTRNGFGNGVGWYIATALEPTALESLVEHIVSEVGAASSRVAEGVEVVRRRADDRDYVFILNHTDAVITHAYAGVELITGCTVVGLGTVEPGGVHIVRQPREHS